MTERSILIIVTIFTLIQSIISVTVTANVWASSGTNFVFPEANLPVMQRPNNGICFAGGGNRAYTAGEGQLRGLYDLGFLSQIRYMVGMSGGSYVITSYAYRQVQNDDAQFLVKGHDPSELTLSLLARAPPYHSMLVAPYVAQHEAGSSMYFQSTTITTVEIAAYLKLPHSTQESTQYWLNLMNNIYYQYIGITGSEMIAWNQSHVSDIIQRNPSLANYKFITPVPQSPYPIVTMTRVAPLPLWPYDANVTRNAFTVVESTPLYTGEPYTKTVTYYQDPRTSDSSSLTLQIGGYVETYAFGGTPNGNPTPITSGSSTASITLFPNGGSQDGFPIKFITGVSSNFEGPNFASGAYAYLPYDLSTKDLVAQIPMFSPTTFLSPTTMFLADGGALENTGIISLILRKVPYIVVFDNAYSQFHEDTNVQCLFGIGLTDSDNTGPNNFYAHNQIFNSSVYTEIQNQITERNNSGLATIAVVNATTIQNTWWGVEAGFECQITWVYLSAHNDFVGRLPQETQLALDGIGSNALANFPHYPTSSFFLSASQINLLAELTNYVVRTNEDIFKAGLGITGTLSPSPSPVSASIAPSLFVIPGYTSTSSASFSTLSQTLLAFLPILWYFLAC